MNENQMPDPMALRMKHCPHQAAAYEKRRAEVFPERRVALKRLGASHDAIWLAPADSQRFGIFTHVLDAVRVRAISKLRRAFTPDIVQCQPIRAPAQVPLKPVFYLP